MRDASGVWCQNSFKIQLSDAGNEEVQIALLHNEACTGYIVRNARLPVQINIDKALLACVYPRTGMCDINKLPPT